MTFSISVALESMLVVGRTVFRTAMALQCTTTETNTLANSSREHLPLQNVYVMFVTGRGSRMATAFLRWQMVTCIQATSKMGRDMELG